MTGKINSREGFGPISGLNATQNKASSKPEAGKAPTDRVNFSSVLQEVSKARETAAPENTERAQKLATLQSQIASGSYQPDLEKVSASLLNFLNGME